MAEPENRRGLVPVMPEDTARRRVRVIFAWYDLWVGVFVDRPKRRTYVFPLPCLGFVIEWKEATDA